MKLAVLVAVMLFALCLTSVLSGITSLDARSWMSGAIDEWSAAPRLAQFSTLVGLAGLLGIPTLGAIAFGASAAGRCKTEIDGLTASIRRFEDAIADSEAETAKLETLYALEAPAALMKPRKIKPNLKVEQVFAQFGELARQLAEAWIEQQDASQRIELIEVLADLAALSNPVMERDEKLFQRTRIIRGGG